jgi:Arc/MetJ-type ribon-helix-helix transcriptional regulator
MTDTTVLEETAVKETARMSPESRSRMISFRLTAEEYDRIHALCFEQGVRSVSELARAALNMLLEQPERTQRETLESRVGEIEGRLRMLSLEVRKLNPTTIRAAPVPPALRLTQRFG